MFTFSPIYIPLIHKSDTVNKWCTKGEKYF